MYTGMLLPNGLQPGIMQDGARAQNADNFITNNSTYSMYLRRLMNLAMSVFEWRNLPDGVDARMLEFWLMRDGFVGFFKDDDLKADPRGRAPEGYAVLPMRIGGQWDMYNYPTDRTAYAVNGLQVPCTEENSVIIFDNYLRDLTYPTLCEYAWRLAKCERTIDVNLDAQKTPKIIRCSDKQRLTFKNLQKEIDGNKYWIWADKNLDLDNIEVLDLTTNYVGGEVQVLKHQYWNEVLTFLGVENVNTEKKERLVSDEVMSNMGDVEAQRFVRLNARKRACEEINKLFGLDVDCDFRSGIYIKADGFAARNLPTLGMQDSMVIGGSETGYDIPKSNSFIETLRNLVGRGQQ